VRSVHGTCFCCACVRHHRHCLVRVGKDLSGRTAYQYARETIIGAPPYFIKNDCRPLASKHSQPDLPYSFRLSFFPYFNLTLSQADFLDAVPEPYPDQAIDRTKGKRKKKRKASLLFGELIKKKNTT